MHPATSYLLYKSGIGASAMTYTGSLFMSLGPTPEANYVQGWPSMLGTSWR